MSDRPYTVLFRCTGNSAVAGSDSIKWLAFRRAFHERLREIGQSRAADEVA